MAITWDVFLFMLCLMCSKTCCTSLNEMKARHKTGTGYNSGEYFSSLIEDIARGFQGELGEKNDSQGEITATAVARIPCVITKIASFLEVSSIKLIASSRFVGITDALQSCEGVFGGSISKSVRYITGNENDFENLRRNAFEYLTIDVRCFVVLCSEVCSSFILQIANTFGFGVDMFLWVTVSPLALSDELRFPKNVLSFAVIASNLKSRDSRVYRGLLKHTDDKKNLDSFKTDKVLMKIIAFPYSSRYSITYDGSLLKESLSLAKKTVLKVVIIIHVFGTQSRPHLLDRIEMKCQHGLLCWVYPSGNRSLKLEPSCCSGHAIDILSKLKVYIYVDYYIYEVRDYSWGSKVNGSWTGLIGDVVYGRADIAADLLVFTKERQTTFDYTAPIYSSDIMLVSRIHISQLPYLNSEAFAALSVKSWISILCLTFFTGGIIYFAERLFYLQPNMTNRCDIFTYAIGLLFQRDIGGLVPKQLGSQTVSIALALCLMIIMTTYTAVLTTRNILDVKTSSISGMNDPKVTNPTTDFKIATYKDSVYSRMFEQSVDIKWKRLGEFMRPYNFHLFTDAYRQLSEGNLKAVIVDTPTLEYGWKNNTYCDLQVIETIYKQGAGFALKKGSPWSKAISHLILKYKNRDALNNIKIQYMAPKCSKEKSHQPKQFGIMYLSGASILLVIGIILSGVFFILEHVMHAYVEKCLGNGDSTSICPFNTDTIDIERADHVR